MKQQKVDWTLLSLYQTLLLRLDPGFATRPRFCDWTLLLRLNIAFATSLHLETGPTYQVLQSPQGQPNKRWDVFSRLKQTHCFTCGLKAGLKSTEGPSKESSLVRVAHYATTHVYERLLSFSTEAAKGFHLTVVVLMCVTSVITSN